MDVVDEASVMPLRRVAGSFVSAGPYTSLLRFPIAFDVFDNWLYVNGVDCESTLASLCEQVHLLGSNFSAKRSSFQIGLQIVDDRFRDAAHAVVDSPSDMRGEDHVPSSLMIGTHAFGWDVSRSITPIRSDFMVYSSLRPG